MSVFRAQAARRPNAAALVAPQRCAGRWVAVARLSYSELDAWSDRMARVLVRTGVRPGDRVALRLARSPALAAALLAVLKAGAAYAPLDDAAPDRRIADVLADIEPVAVLCGAPDTERFTALGVRALPVSPEPFGEWQDEAPDMRLPDVEPSDLAYLMHTSGSAGRPKAVMVEHHSIVNLADQPEVIELGPADRLLQLAPVAFDASTFEIWGALLNGARLVVAPGGMVPPEELGELLRAAGVTVLWLTAALFHRQVDVDCAAFRTVRAVLTGGDVVSADHVKRLMAAVPSCTVVNGYGPTETTTFACCHRITDPAALGATVPIGRPLRGVDLRIVRETTPATPAPDGTPGELWIGGEGVSRGYWRQPELTDSAFVTALSADGRSAARYYRSGDRVLRRPDGLLEFLGRLDDQIKLRGYRIEPGEVEKALTGHVSVRGAAVGVRPSTRGAPRLVAWVVPAEVPLDRGQLRAHLLARLPGYMVPAVFVVLDELPVTANGKVDRLSLPDPDWSSRAIYA